MSADNWTVCPRCIFRIDDENNKIKKKLYDQYGKIPIDEWSRLEYDTLSQLHLKESTFREDYEIGISKDGEFTVDYRGSCSVCKLSYKYKYVTVIDMEDQ